MDRALAALTIVWLAVLGLGMAAPVRAASPLVPVLVYAAAGRVCHQNPERSFHSGGVQWPVCARCAGLYLAAPFGALLALRRRTAIARRHAVTAIAIFGAPTAVTFAAEHLAGLPMTNVVRFVAAWPLGGAIAWIIVATAGSAVTHRVH